MNRSDSTSAASRSTGTKARRASGPRPRGDEIGLYHFAMPPDIAADAGDVNAVRRLYRGIAQGAGLGLVEAELTILDGCRAIRVILKAPQQGHGMTYLASLTLPFRDMSWVIKVLCPEHSITGMRDSAVLAKVLASGKVTRSDSGALVGWWSDPYDVTAAGSLLANLSESRDYDADFPEHPLSRARRILGRIEATFSLDARVREAAPFVFGAKARKKPWWRFV